MKRKRNITIVNISEVIEKLPSKDVNISMGDENAKMAEDNIGYEEIYIMGNCGIRGMRMSTEKGLRTYVPLMDFNGH